MRPGAGRPSSGAAPSEPAQAIGLVIVSWNTAELLVRCLRSLQADVVAGRVEVVVVDNGSADDSVHLAQEAAPWATVIEAGENLGFGPAVNRGAAMLSGPWLVAANADVEFHAGALERMRTAALAHPRAGAVAPRLLLPDGATQHSTHPFPTLSVSVIFNLGLYRVVPGLGERLCLEGFWDPSRPRPVPWAIGACMLLRRRAFDEVGGFDDRQWMYAEDLDLCWRLRSAGWTVRYEPDAVVEHVASAATAVAFGSSVTTRFMAATYSMLLRRRGIAFVWAVAGLNTLGVLLRLLWMGPLALGSARWRARVRTMLVWLRAHATGLAPPSRVARAR
jgi:N-acetylglucosaminyl-diphospho-decaprenol L-rhamnosyltransferase